MIASPGLAEDKAQ